MWLIPKHCETGCLNYIRDARNDRDLARSIVLEYLEENGTEVVGTVDSETGTVHFDENHGIRFRLTRNRKYA